MNKKINYFLVASLYIIAWICFVILAPQVVFSQSRILISGDPADHRGVALWNADGSGLEPAASGHILPWGTKFEHYYVATADYGGIDPNSSAGLTGISIVAGFANFEAALSANGFAISDATIKWG